MKEKITAILTLGCIFSLFFYYKVNTTTDDSFTSINNLDETQEIVEKLIIDVENIETELSDSFEQLSPSQSNDECSLDQNETDVLAFSDAFKYYRDCNGKTSTFVWNEVEYTTVLASEKSETYDSIANNESTIKNNKVDKHHYSLQKEMSGISLDAK
ncbi:MAG: hypothetical protein CMG09_03000 [Candidatus Marinimicrobia bacterium]|nr:hypothetical protein [Candidatus Neomarinimicrobiota bacterium]